jgi:carboxyl-terminal processing protease
LLARLAQWPVVRLEPIVVLLLTAWSFLVPALACTPAPLPAFGPLTLTVAERLAVVDAVDAAVRGAHLEPGDGWAGAAERARTQARNAASDAEFHRTVRALVEGLGDGHSAYLSAEEARLEDEGGLPVVGIGAYLAEIDGLRRIVRVLPGGPAALAGVRRGDALVAVDGRDCFGREQVLGESGSPVTLRLRAPDGSEGDVRVLRGATRTLPAPAGRRIGPAAYLELPGFSRPDTADLFEAEVERLLAGPPSSGLIVDLRGNPGGDGPQLRRVLGNFLDGPIGRLSGRGGNTTMTTLPGRLRQRLAGVPLVVLVDGGSESAAELFSAALQASGRARVVGSPTPGNTEGVRPFALPGGARLWLATSDFHLLDGRRLGGSGVRPDLVVPPDWARVGRDDDPVIAAAVALVNPLHRCCG